jgi:hypothetical protein
MPAATAALILSAAAGAAAQTAAPAPRQGTNAVFGREVGKPNPRQKLDVNITAGEGYDTDVPTEVRTQVGLGGNSAAGFATQASVTAAYAWAGPTIQVRANATSWLRSFRPVGSFQYRVSPSFSHSGNVAFSARLTQRTTLRVNQVLQVSPAALYNLIPRPTDAIQSDADAAPLLTAPPEYAISGPQSRSGITSVSLGRAFGPRTNLETTADYQYTGTTGGIDGGRELETFGVRGRASRRLAPNTTLVGEVGYLQGTSGLRNGSLPSGRQSDLGADAGLDYRPALSATRHFSFGFRAGFTRFEIPETEAAALGTRSYDRVTGEITMGYEFGRTWQMRGIARRGVEYVPGLVAPVSADSFSVSVDGLFARRLDFFLSAGYSSGQSLFTRGTSFYDTYAGEARLGYAVTRMLAFSIGYVYYLYDTKGTDPLIDNFPALLQRQGVRAGVAMRVPVLRR